MLWHFRVVKVTAAILLNAFAVLHVSASAALQYSSCRSASIASLEHAASNISIMLVSLYSWTLSSLLGVLGCCFPEGLCMSALIKSAEIYAGLNPGSIDQIIFSNTGEAIQQLCIDNLQLLDGNAV